MITFEEYKKQFEIFCKIDTPEKLAICESQYKRELLRIEAQSHFEPFEYQSGDDLSSRYEQHLHSLLPFNNIRENQLSLLIKPSFEPESLLVIDKLQDSYTLTYTTLAANYWYLFYEDNKVTTVEKSTLTSKLNKKLGHKLFTLIDTAILEARKPMGGSAVLDGVVYVFSRILDNKQITVFKHSPDEGSKTGKIINIMQYLTDNIMSLDTAGHSALENLLGACQNK